MFLPSPAGLPLKVGILRSSSIGDVILASSCLQILAQLPLPVEVTWLGRYPSLGLIEQAFPSVRCLALPPSSPGSAFLTALQDLHFLVDLQGNLRARLLTRAFSKTYKRRVYHWRKRSLQRTRWVWQAQVWGRRRPLPASCLRAAKPQYQLMADTLRLALQEQLPAEFCYGLKDFDPFPRFNTAADPSRLPWRQELRFGRWLAVAPGASYATKRAPLAVLAAILKRVEAQYRLTQQAQQPLGLVFLGDKADQEVIGTLNQLLGWEEPVLNLAGKLSLWQSALALKECEALLSNDSALSHLAEAVDTPVAVLFGPTVEGFGFAPRKKESRSFSVPLGCRPCSKHGKSPCRYGDQRCFTELPVQGIADYLCSLLLAAVKAVTTGNSTTASHPAPSTVEEES